MDLASNKWLNGLVSKFKKDYKERFEELCHLYSFDSNNSDFVYKMLHITGLLFGHPTRPLFSVHPEFEEWPNDEKTKYILAETLYHTYLFNHRSELQLGEPQDIDALFNEATHHIFEFYSKYAPQEGIDFNVFDIFTKKDSDYYKLEKTIDKRISYSSVIQKKFWSGALYNTFVFLDLVYYAMWHQTQGKEFYKRHESIQLLTLKVIISAFLSKDVLLWKDRSILNYFLSSAIVSENSQKLITGYLTDGLDLEDIHFSNTTPQIFNLMLLELGIMAALADKDTSEGSQKYINNLAKKLEFDEDTLENSILMVESFIHANSEKVLYLKDNHNLNLFSSSINHRLHAMIKKNKAKIIREISESKELVELLWKAQNTQLTKEEKDKIKEQISDLLRTIPSLAIFMIPGGSFLLPILYKILPEDLLKPSSYRNP